MNKQTYRNIERVADSMANGQWKQARQQAKGISFRRLYVYLREMGFDGETLSHDLEIVKRREP